MDYHSNKALDFTFQIQINITSLIKGNHYYIYNIIFEFQYSFFLWTL